MSQYHGSFDRRTFLKLGGTTLMSAVLGQVAQPNAAIGATSTITPELALQTLMDGNQRFVQQQPIGFHRSANRRAELAQGQRPIATILSCADSRVPAELLFDLGFGDLFNVRVAGNIVTPEVLASLEYAVELLETPVMMVLGHERCGAVTAAVKQQVVPGHIADFIDEIQPAVARSRDLPGDPIDNAITTNVQLQIERLLQRSSLISQRQTNGQVNVLGALYDLDSGTVRLL